MKITNVTGLPKVLVTAVSNQRKPKPDSVSCTELIDSPLVRRLKLEHWDILEVDVAEQVKAMLGTALHAYIESHAGDGEASELYLEKEIDGFKVTGTCDYLHDGVLSDWKTTSVWSVMLNNEWLDKVERQLQVYAWLLSATTHPVDRLEAVVVFTDWRRGESLSKQDYPPQNVQSYSFKVWPKEKVEAYIKERIRLHKDPYYVCSLEERWSRASTYAVMKEGRKTAVRVFPSQSEAFNYKQDFDDKYSVVHRPGEHIRCQDYCPARAVCSAKVEVKKVEEDE
jgi:hypothetical protein